MNGSYAIVHVTSVPALVDVQSLVLCEPSSKENLALCVRHQPFFCTLSLPKLKFIRCPLTGGNPSGNLVLLALSEYAVKLLLPKRRALKV